MFKLFKKNQKNVDKKPVSEKPVNKQYTDPELFQALQEDELSITEQDIQKARENDPETLYKIGDIYYKINKKKSFAWFHKAALQEHEEAQMRVGMMYRRGWGVSEDYKQAMRWYMKAASTGNAKGQYQVGELYYFGWGVSTDEKQALDWYLKAANNGNADAMNSIGYMYQDGFGVTKSIPSAIEWHTKAANHGHDHAQNTLGDIYKNEERYKDLQKAVNWYQKAADNNHYSAKNQVKALNEQGYYVKDEEQENETIKDNNVADTITNDQIQPSTSSSNDEHISKAIDDKIKAIEKTFQSKMSLMEVNTDALQKELAALKQERLQQHEEIKELREKLARTEPRIGGNLEDNDNDYEDDINYDTECSDGEEEQGDDHILMSNMTVLEGNGDNLQKEIVASKQKELEQDKENRLLKERLARTKAGLEDEAHNDPNCYSSDDESDKNNDINYDSGCSNDEDNNNAPKKTHQTSNHRQWFETPADPNYDSSDNEDPKNDIYLD